MAATFAEVANNLKQQWRVGGGIGSRQALIFDGPHELTLQDRSALSKEIESSTKQTVVNVDIAYNYVTVTVDSSVFRRC